MAYMLSAMGLTAVRYDSEKPSELLGRQHFRTRHRIESGSGQDRVDTFRG